MIGTVVVIKATGIRGYVRGTWKDDQGRDRVCVRYYDTTGVVHEDWFDAPEVVAAGEEVKGTA